LLFKSQHRLAGCTVVALLVISLPGSAKFPLHWGLQPTVEAHVTTSFTPEPSTQIIPTAPKPAAKPRRFSGLFGIASWYGAVLNGHRTASGEIFDMNRLTAAHRTLPFGTMVRVTDVQSGKSVVVRINDRGILFPGRVIDLSRGAADRLGIRKSGITNVRLEILNKHQAQAEIAAAEASSESAESK
jgi:rare lipoprotein A